MTLKYIKDESYISPRDANRFGALQQTFVALRKASCRTQQDIATVLGLDASTIAHAENLNGTIWPRFFLSSATITAYLGKDAPVSQRLAIEKQVYEAFYPNGITTLAQLVRFVAYKQGKSVQDLSNQLNIPHLSVKIDENSIHRQLLPKESVDLHNYLSDKVRAYSYLGVNQEVLDRVLPNPIQDAELESFSSMLNRWALMVTNTHAYEFVRYVSSLNCKDYPNPRTTLYQWGTGQGLASTLPYIVQALETNPNTKELFPACKDSFIAAAEEVIPAKAGGNLSEQLIKAPTIGRALAVLEKRSTNPLNEAEVLGAFHDYFGCDYGPQDYAEWKQGKLPQDVSFGGRLVEVIVDLLNKKTGAWITLEAREHLRALSGPVDAQASNRWVNALSQLKPIEQQTTR